MLRTLRSLLGRPTGTAPPDPQTAPDIVEATVDGREGPKVTLRSC
jgi:hypothetical protein